MEGGGPGKNTQARLRIGMDKFLTTIKNAVREKNKDTEREEKWKWNLTCCGGRDNAISKFRKAHAKGVQDIVILLVDSEKPVNTSPRAHLNRRDLNVVDDDSVHLMVQVMETWIIADRNALITYYGQHFRADAIPSHHDLEEVGKGDAEDALKRATERTTKGRYQKIQHAADLLARIDPAKVRERCYHCARLFDTLGAAIAAR